MTTNTIELSMEDGGRIVRLRGDLNFATVDEARSGLLEAIESAPETVIVDLRDVTLLASMGIELLLDAARRCERRTCILLVNSRVDEVLRIAGVQKHFRVARSEVEADRMAGVAR